MHLCTSYCTLSHSHSGFRPWINGFVPLVLPTTACTLYYFVSLTLLGDTADFAYSQLDNASLIQISSLFGIAAVRFFVLWFAAVVYDLVDARMRM